MDFSQSIDQNALAKTTLRVQSFYEYWVKICGDQKIPLRDNFDPMAIPKHLPGILLVDVIGITEAGFGIFRYRLAGDLEIEARGFNPTGKLVEDAYIADTAQEALDVYEYVRTQKSPLLTPTSYRTRYNVRIEEYSLLVPLTKNGTDVSQILVYSDERLSDQHQ
ncbi:MAG: PAS domain-containing protein [Alphaproteobacteria bacterium]|nr:PAS domain-containing protein [Alphaproteobacteria bacterium]